jgi:hypothetical protein
VRFLFASSHRRRNSGLAARLKPPDHVMEQLKAAVAAEDVVTFWELCASPRTHVNEQSCIMHGGVPEQEV